MLYSLYEAQHTALAPLRVVADFYRGWFGNPFSPFAYLPLARRLAATSDLFLRVTERYEKPDWNVEGAQMEVALERPFCQLVRFSAKNSSRGQAKVLLVAPLSGYHATLLRDTVRSLLLENDVWVTDWVDARMVPLADGGFDLDDYIDYVISILHALGGDTHVVAVCQPSVPVLAAVAYMEAREDAYAPLSMTLMGGPIDTRENPTVVNKLAEDRGIEWFRRHVITKVPFPHPGFMRDVYPGFLQLNGFMTMNLDRHIEAHRNLFRHLVDGDGDSATKHREFYDEYLAVMDLSAEFYLQTVETVFIRHDLPKGRMKHRGKAVDPSKIRRVALLTIEGEHDDISGVGQTQAAHKLCSNLPDEKKAHYLQPGVGHYGVFNGSRFRSEIAPRISDFVLTHNARHKSVKRKVLAEV